MVSSEIPGEICKVFEPLWIQFRNYHAPHVGKYILEWQFKTVGGQVVTESFETCLSDSAFGLSHNGEDYLFGTPQAT